MHIALVVLYATVCGWLIVKLPYFEVPRISRKALLGLFGVKLCGGLALWWLYTYYYPDRSTADIYKYFDDGNALFAVLQDRPVEYLKMLTGIGEVTPTMEAVYANDMNHWHMAYDRGIFNGNRVMIRLNAFLRLFSFGYMNVHTVILCFASMVGSTALLRGVARLLPGRERLLAAAIFLLPSVLLWSSGMLKESVVMLCMGALLEQVLGWSEQKRRWLSVVIMVAGTWVLLYLKLYLIAVLVPFVLVYWLASSRGNKAVFGSYALAVTLLVTFAFTQRYFMPNYDLLYNISKKHEDIVRLNQSVEAGSSFDLGEIRDTPASVASKAPLAFATTLLRPLPWEASSPFMLLASAEALLLLVLLVVAALPGTRAHTNWNLVLLIVCVTVFLYTLIGLTTPNFGTLVRYRVPVLPLLAIVPVALINREKILKKWPKTERYL